MVNITVSGLTTARKTTHCNLLAPTLGYSCVSAADVLLDISGMRAPDSRAMWFSGPERVEAVRNAGRLDERLDAMLRSMAVERSRTIFDSWAVAWISPEPVVRVWLEADRRSRAWKCYLSQAEPRMLSVEECASHIDQKDSGAQSRFAVQHGFELFRGHSQFDVVLDNSTFIRAPSRDAVDEGIATFRPYFEAAILSALHSDPAPLAELAALNKERARRAIRRSPFPQLLTELW